MTYEEYEAIPKQTKLKIAKDRNINNELMNYLCYDSDDDIRYAVVQNEAIPLTKLKKFARTDKCLAVKHKALEAYEDKYIF